MGERAEVDDDDDDDDDACQPLVNKASSSSNLIFACHPLFLCATLPPACPPPSRYTPSNCMQTNHTQAFDAFKTHREREKERDREGERETQIR